MIIGLGTDIVELARIETIFNKFGHHFVKKILSSAEIAALPIRPAAYLAGRFAAKEAAVKALGTGFSGGIGPRDIEIACNAQGTPCLRFFNQADARARALGVTRSFLSISHERSVAVAVVVLEA
jgi:holo-[acyl-carrier protein] synthase